MRMHVSALSLRHLQYSLVAWPSSLARPSVRGLVAIPYERDASYTHLEPTTPTTGQAQSSILYSIVLGSTEVQYFVLTPNSCTGRYGDRTATRNASTPPRPHLARSGEVTQEQL